MKSENRMTTLYRKFEIENHFASGILKNRKIKKNCKNEKEESTPLY